MQNNMAIVKMLIAFLFLAFPGKIICSKPAKCGDLIKLEEFSKEVDFEVDANEG